jgi:uncharacterized membrane protein
MEFTLTERNLVLVAHILGAILCIGPVTLATSLFPRFAIDGDRSVCALMHRISYRYGIASLIVPVLGFILAIRLKILDETWIQASLGVFFAAFILLVAYVLPKQRTLMQEREAPVTREDVQGLRMMTGIYAVSWVVVLYFMVAKPF